VNGNLVDFQGGTFDGRYIYMMQSQNTNQGYLLRYDTTLPFATGSSYAYINTQAINTFSYGFFGSVFDGRYVYFVQNNIGITAGGQITRYDTTLPFGNSTSYFFLNTNLASSLSAGFNGGIFDGRYVYLVPNLYGQITRIDAYPGSPISGMLTANAAANGFALGTGLTNVQTATSASAGASSIPAQPAGYIFFTINGTPQKIPYYN
jgi:hypothetical protein